MGDSLHRHTVLEMSAAALTCLHFQHKRCSPPSAGCELREDHFIYPKSAPPAGKYSGASRITHLSMCSVATNEKLTTMTLMILLPLSFLFQTDNDSTQEKGVKAFLFRGQRDISRPSPLLLRNAMQSLLCLNPSFKITKSAQEANYLPQTASLKMAPG